MIDTQATVGGWPELPSAAAPADADHDGMPDEWEVAKGLNPENAADRNSDINGNGYTNLEDYLNGLLGDTESAVLMQAYEPVPADKSAIAELEELVLSWRGNATTYDIYIGTSPEELQLKAAALTTASYTLKGLVAASDYFWKVTAHGEGQLSMEGEVWSFTTPSVTGWGESAVKNDFLIYPNPVADQLTVVFELAKKELVSVVLYNMQGRKITELAPAAIMQAGAQHLTISLKDVGGDKLQKGIYLCAIKTSDRFITHKVIYLKE